MKVTVALEPQEEGGYSVYAPSLSGCISQGNTKREALRNIKEAIELYLEVNEAEVRAVKGKERLERYVRSNYLHSPSIRGTGSLEDAGTEEDL